MKMSCRWEAIPWSAKINSQAAVAGVAAKRSPQQRRELRRPMFAPLLGALASAFDPSHPPSPPYLNKMIDVARLIKLFDQLGETWRIDSGEASDQMKSSIANLPIPEALAYLVTSNWPQTPGLAFINGYYIDSTEQLFSTENIEELIPNRLLSIGSAISGDTLAIDWSVDPPCLVVLNHEEWEPNGDPRQQSAVVSPSLERFLQSAINGEPVPGDYYDARESPPT